MMGIHASHIKLFCHINVSRDKKNCNKVTFRNKFVLFVKIKGGKMEWNELSCPNNRDIRITEFLPPSLSEQEGKSKVLGGERREIGVCV